MGSEAAGLEDAIREAMAAVRGSTQHPESSEAVDAVLHALTDRAEGLGRGDALVRPLSDAEEAFRAGEVGKTVQRLSHALIQVTRLSPLRGDGRR